jgi:hypothetical protein
MEPTRTFSAKRSEKSLHLTFSPVGFWMHRRKAWMSSGAAHRLTGDLQLHGQLTPGGAAAGKHQQTEKTAENYSHTALHSIRPRAP